MKAPLQLETARLILTPPTAADATEALQAMVDVSRRINVVRLSALCHPEHRASWHVLEKCGFKRDEDWSGQAAFPNLAPGALLDVLWYQLVFTP